MPDLLRCAGYVDGEWVEAGSAGSFEVRDPASGATLAVLPRMGAPETATAIAAAERALPGWRARTARDRGRLLRRWADAMLGHREELAALLTAEQGKPLAEARVEIDYAASFLEWFGEEGRRAYGDVVPAHLPGARIVVVREPVGVTCGITPWNFPAAMPTRKFAPALAAGCTMVLKPAEQTPLSALAIAELGRRVGVPAGVLSVVVGAREDAAAIGAAMTSHPAVRKIGFTGSTAVGKLLMSQCAAGVKRVSLELGGNAPFIVFADADLDAAVAGALASKFRNSGQTCIATNRILVHAEVAEPFTERLVAAVRELVVGSGMDPASQVGPLIASAAVAKVERHIADAVARGARVIVGGGRHERGGTFFEPTVLVDVDVASEMCHEETFGPVAAIRTFAADAEAIAIANDSDYGLAGYLYGRDLARVWAAVDALELGMVGVNTGLISTEVAPFGGIKQSGIGREGSHYGLDEWLETKYVSIGASQAP